MSSWFALPDEVMEDVWFTAERLWRTAWIGRYALRSNNCVALTAQISKPLSVLAKEWNCSIKVVRNTLEGLQKRALIRVSFGKVKGKVQTVITCLFSRFYDEAKLEKGTVRANKGHGEGHIYKEDSEDSKNLKEDSCPPPASDETSPGPASEAGPSPTPPPNPRPSRATEFEPIWKAMPPMARKRGSKQEALKEWCKLNGGERVDAARGVKFWERNEFAMAAERWLKRKMWVGLLELELEPAGAQSRASKW